MIITRRDLNSRLAVWFLGKKNTEAAKNEILRLFSKEPGHGNEWTEQDIYEQSRKIIARWDQA